VAEEDEPWIGQQASEPRNGLAESGSVGARKLSVSAGHPKKEWRGFTRSQKNELVGDPCLDIKDKFSHGNSWFVQNCSLGKRSAQFLIPKELNTAILSLNTMTKYQGHRNSGSRVVWRWRMPLSNPRWISASKWFLEDSIP
jgi:hypothetical protein